MPNGYTNMSNYEAYKAGRGLPSCRIFFIVPESLDATTYDNKFMHSRFVGTMNECGKNLINYPNCKIV